LLLVIILISIFMAWMFNSFRMVVVSIIPNLIPLLLTGAIMGYFGIALKPSTILVFSIAFGISVDDTIHFLAKYRQELLMNNWNIRKSVFSALNETGVSMFYTSVVLFFGFFIFVASDFGGTIALGLLVSITLMLAMLSNLLLLPALLLSLEKIINYEAFQEPLLDTFDEEEDIELDELKVKRKEK
jgi:predicted RND superfamily exporter protein